MQLTYQKLGSDHPMFGKVEFVVADGLKPVCYKTKEGYLPLEEGAAPSMAAESAAPDVKTRTLYVLSFKVSGEAEQMTFTSEKKLKKTIALYEEKAFISDMKTESYDVLV